jgi:hypothetical protein
MAARYDSLPDSAVWQILAACRRRVIKNAKRAKKPMGVSTEHLVKLFNQQQGICAITGHVMDTRKLPVCDSNPWKISVDRIDSSKGYVDGNLQLVCIGANFMKNTWDDAVIKEFAKFPISKEAA